MQCTKCSSDNTQRLEVVFDHGTQRISASGQVIGTGAGSTPGAGGTVSLHGTAQTKMAGKVAPPDKKTHGNAAIVLVIGFFCVKLIDKSALGFLLLLLCACISCFLVYKTKSYNKKVWPGLYQHWKDSWLCNKCGNIYHQP